MNGIKDAISVLTTYVKVTRDEYEIFAHSLGARGSVTLKSGSTFQWEIEPGYAAVVRSAGQEPVYLLLPKLKKAKGE